MDSSGFTFRPSRSVEIGSNAGKKTSGDTLGQLIPRRTSRWQHCSEVLVRRWRGLCQGEIQRPLGVRVVQTRKGAESDPSGCVLPGLVHQQLRVRGWTRVSFPSRSLNGANTGHSRLFFATPDHPSLVFTVCARSRSACSQPSRGSARTPNQLSVLRFGSLADS